MKMVRIPTAPISRSLAVVLAVLVALAGIAMARALVGSSIQPAPLQVPAETGAPAPATDASPGSLPLAPTAAPGTQTNPTAAPAAPASTPELPPAATAAPHATVPVGPATTAAPGYDLPAIAPEPGIPGFSPPPTHE